MSESGGHCPQKHTSGSISFAERHKRIVRFQFVSNVILDRKVNLIILDFALYMWSKEKEDIAPLIDVFHKTHTRVDGTFVDNCAKTISDEFQKKLTKHFADHQAVQAGGGGGVLSPITRPP